MLSFGRVGNAAYRDVPNIYVSVASSSRVVLAYKAVDPYCGS
jgi:hypothetical protein